MRLLKVWLLKVWLLKVWLVVWLVVLTGSRSGAQPVDVLWGPSPGEAEARAASTPAAPGTTSARLLSLDDPAYRWIDRLQRRGHLLALNPTALPYTEGEIGRALLALSAADLSGVEAVWAERLRERLSPSLGSDARSGTFGLELAAGGAASNNERLDPVRFTDAADPTVEAGGVNLYPNASGRASLAVGPVVAQLGMGFDLFYRDDPDGLPVVKELALRNEETSVGVATPLVDVRLGNLGRHWGRPDGDGVFVSVNPRSYDAVSLRLGGGTLALRSVAAELDAATLEGEFTGRTGNQSREPSLRRYLVAHRFDWRPRPWLTVAFVESMLYSGRNASLSLPSVLPTALYAFLNDGPPKNNENNNIIGGLFHVQRGRVAVTGQLALDDFDVLRKGETAEPASLALTGDLTVAGVGHDRVDAGLSLTAVTSRAYDTGFPEQSFLFAERGLGTQFSDYLHARAFAEAALGRSAGLTVRPELHLLVQGERDIRQPYPANDVPLIFVGTAERTVRAGLQVRLQPSPWWWVQADLGVNRTSNEGFVDGATVTRFVGLVEGGARIRLRAPTRLSW